MCPKEQFIIKYIKSNQFSFPPLFSMLCGWGWFAPAFLTSPKLKNEGEEETLGQKKNNFCLGHNIIAVIVGQHFYYHQRCIYLSHNG